MINIYSAKIDYVHPLKRIEIRSRNKNKFVQTDSEVDYERNSGTAGP